MEISQTVQFDITLYNEEIGHFRDLVYKLSTKPKSVGFVKNDFNEAERDLLNTFFEAFDYSDKEGKQHTVPASERRTIESSE